MTVDDATLAVTIGFVPGSLACPDADHPGLLRAGPRSSAPYAREDVERHECRATDMTRDTDERPGLLDAGFDTVDLTTFDVLQRVFARVRVAGRLTDEDATTIRSTLQDAVLECSDGRTISVLFIAEEGLIMRTAGPGGTAVVGPRPDGMNDHGAATSIHSDQDVFGTPLAQLMEGRAPTLFRHDSPDGSNRDAELMLVNMWIPLQQITQPLVLADGRSIDRRRHQLRYGLGTESFLDRDEDVAINDIWTFLHDPGQRWYLRSEMGHGMAYVFDTLSTPHGACTLPGEDLAARCSMALEDAEAALARGDVASFARAVETVRPEVPLGVPAGLRDAIAAMAAVADEGRRDPVSVRGDGAHAWLERSSAARRRVVRMSVELRMVVAIDG